MERFKIINGKDFTELPKTSGVYLFYAQNTPIYIGKAINIQNRVKNHFQGNYWWEKTLLRQGFAGQVGFFETNSEIEALVLEANLIKKYQPKFNVIWKDDKNYFYVAFAKNNLDAPYVFITHQRNKTAEYVGPFVEGTALKKTLRFLRKAFPYYSVKNHPKNKCTYCHLGLCPGPRLFEARLASPTGEAAKLLAEYKKNIKKLILILQGKRSAVLNSLKKEMAQYSKNSQFEKAGEIRDRIFALQQIMAHTHVIEAGSQNIATSDVAINLSKIIGLEKPVSRIECYDVSNIQGKQATGSMVVFINGVADKSEYKKFKIRLGDKPNDIAMLKETLERRFAHPEWTYPEVILIDGGIAQLNIAIKAKNERLKTSGIKVISIAKGRQELFIEGRKEPIPLKLLPQEIYNLVKYLDDEAHRFAITYHKKLRKKNLLK